MRKYSKEQLEEAVNNSDTWSGAMRNLGIKPSGGNHRSIQNKVRFFGIDTSHFLGVYWASGKTADTDDRIKRNPYKTPDEEVFCENSHIVGGGRLKNRLLSLGFEYKCNECGLVEWRGKSISLHVDHINGITNDNRLNNLRFMCPNCHQQTDTWGNNNGRTTPHYHKPTTVAQDKRVYIKGKMSRSCLFCNMEFHVKRSSKQKYCSYKCCTMSSRKLILTDEELSKIVWEYPAIKIAEMYGVSDNAVHNRCRRLGIKTPGLGYWSKIRALGETEATEVLGTSA